MSMVVSTFKVPKVALWASMNDSRVIIGRRRSGSSSRGQTMAAATDTRTDGKGSLKVGGVCVLGVGGVGWKVAWSI